MLSPIASPSAARFSLSMPAPCDHRAAGDAGPEYTPTVIRPLRTGSSPKIVRSSRVRPAPSRPAMPTISPRRSVSVAPPGWSSLSSSSASPGSRGVRG